MKEIAKMKLPILLTFVLLAIYPQFGFAQKPKATPENVAAAIEKCVTFLSLAQIKGGERNGSWFGSDNVKEYGTGQTSLVTLALLSAGKTPKSSEVSLALNYIRDKVPRKTYEAALKVMVLCAAEPNKSKDQIQKTVNWLCRTQLQNGGWTYGENGGSGDESNAQFAVLALWEASKIGIFSTEPNRKSEDVFNGCAAYWLNQKKGAVWGYSGSGPTASMTCAGIASMIILQDASSNLDAYADKNQVHCCGQKEETKRNEPSFNLSESMDALGQRFAVTHNNGATGWTFYYLYALERVGRLTGQRLIGTHDWYREGAEFMLASQQLGGSFQDTNLDNISSTAMALLFLSKGKRQVVVGHLQFGNDDDWRHHRRSVQNLTGHIESVWKRELAWQSVQLEKATLKDLLETPVLFISGSREFKLNDNQRKLLKEYVEQNGFIFAEACNGEGCNGAEFERSFRSEMEKIFDKPMQKLPPSHPLWSAETRVDPNALPKDFWLYGVEACCRTSVVFSPISLSCRWELSRPYGIAKKYSPSVDADIQNAVKIGVNVAAYATGRELKDKLDAVQIVQSQSNRPPLDRGSLAIGKIMHSGGSDDASKAVSNLLEVYHNWTLALVEKKTPMVSLASDETQKYPLLYIHGRNNFSFTETEAAGLRKHFETGGFVMGDSICASADFTASVRKEFAKALPDSTWRTLDPKHPIMLRNAFGSFDLGSVSLVDPSNPSSDIKQAKREGPAEIFALEWKGRIVMLFSPNDLSCAMETKHSMQCRGYVRENAFQIGFNMILFGLGLGG